MMKQILPLDSTRYQRHLIHGEDRDWAETNCYADVWIELLHAWGFEPRAALAFTVAIDFEGDQWTFFKFPHADLFELYGLDVQELALWQPLIRHIEEQVGQGRPVLVEMDSFYLPDTAGTAYQRAHVKSTIAVNEIDVENRRLGYFHSQGYYHLHDADFVGVFHLQGPVDSARMPPFAEFVKRRSVTSPRGKDLTERSVSLLKRRWSLLPEHNPFEAFKTRLEADLKWLTAETLDTFHQYSFATLRQFGACYELAATYLRWLHESQVAHLEDAIAAFSDLSTGAKTVQFQLARAMARKKPLELSAIDHMAKQWKVAMVELDKKFH